MRAVAIFVLLFLAATARAGEVASSFVWVTIDDATEAKLGPFPYDRAQIAKAIDTCVKLKAKAVGLKFFYDLPRSAEGDAALAKSMKAVPVALEACLSQPDPAPTELLARFGLGDHLLPSTIAGGRGWIPLPMLQATAAKVGFVDYAVPEEIPLVENYRGVSYPSMVLSCLELAAGSPARFGPGGKVFVGSGWLPVDANNVYRPDLEGLAPFSAISFAQLVAGEVKPESMAGRVVLIGEDSKSTPVISTAKGQMRNHRFFAQCLAAAERELKASAGEKPKG